MKTLEKRQILIKANQEDGSNGQANSGGEEAEGRTPKIKLERVLTERKILEQTRGCEFLVGLKFSFQTPDNLNLVMDLKSGGELMSYMQRFGGRFEESWVSLLSLSLFFLNRALILTLTGSIHR
jgi:serine/threonine protein kinase